LSGWPASLPPPQFVLLGNGNAHEDFAALAQAKLLPHCDVQLDSPSLMCLARLVASCDAFVGADGGGMHLALALQRPGTALFGPVSPDLRLLPGASLWPIAAGSEDLQHIAPAQVADRLLRQCAARLRAAQSTRT
jgi:ADP-heptose:LPS heptosyltransferase